MNGYSFGKPNGRAPGRGNWVAAALLALPVAALAQSGQPVGDVFDSFFRFTESEHKVVFQEHAGETVDPFTGTLRIVQEDLFLPGRAGLDLHVVRTYSSKIWGRADLQDVEPLLAEKERSVLGYGWSLHMGRLRSPNAITPTLGCGGEYPVYEAPDGSARVFYPLPGDPGRRFLQSKDYWRLDLDCFGGGRGACIWSTDGVRRELPAPENQFFIGTTPVWPVARIEDPHGNRIEIAYQPQTGAVTRITDSYDRVVEFNYLGGEDGLRLDSLVANGRTYQYYYQPAQTWAGPRRFLAEVQPPAGPSYLYDYGHALPVEENQHALVSITYPGGGSTTYGYWPAEFFTGREKVPFSVVTSRTVWDGQTAATWYYEYSSPGPACGDLVFDPGNVCSTDPGTGQPTNLHVTTIWRPDSKVDTYTIYGFGFVADTATLAQRATFAVGLVAERATADRAEVERSRWAYHPQPIASTPYSAPVYAGNCGPYAVWDDSVWAPVLKGREVTRDGATFVTEYDDFDPYGQPRLSVETGRVGDLAAQQPPFVRTTRWEYAYAPATHVVRGKPTRATVEEGGDQVETTWSYDGPALSKQTEVRNGVVTSFRYHPGGDLFEVRNALGQALRLEGYQQGLATTLDFNGAFQVVRVPSWEGWVLSERNGRGFTTAYAYDAIGRPTLVAPPGAADPTTYEYAADGRSVTLSRGLYRKVSTLDGLGRVIATSDSEGVQSSSYYDAMGLLAFQSYPYDASTGEHGESLERDGLGRVYRAVRGASLDAAGTCDADGVCSVWTDQAGGCEIVSVERSSLEVMPTGRCYTSFGDPGERRLRQVQDAVGNRWEYAHDAAGQLLGVKAPLARGDRAYQYDGNRYLRSEQTGEAGTVTFGRNALGQMTWRTDARQVTASYEYADLLGRLTQVRYGTGDDVTQSHDEANNLSQLSSANGGSYAYGHDEQNRLTSQTWLHEGTSYTTTYHHDAAGCLDRMTYPTGTVVTQTCDTANRPTRVEAGGTLLADLVSYHPTGQVASARYGNGVVTQASYDRRGRLEALAAAGVMDLRYGYDGADNVKSYEDRAVAGSLRTMTYDPLDRLATAVAAGRWGTRSYGYDALGNRRTRAGGAVASYSYDDQNRLSFVTGASGLAPLRLTWSEAGRLVGTSDGASYRYDGHGRRVEKAEGSGRTVYHHDAAGRVIAETAPDGTGIREYYYLGNRLLAVKGCVSGGCGEVEWYHTDALGSVVARTGGSGAVVMARLEYEPWGERWTSSGVAGDRQYNGRVFDPGTGFHDYGARLYWPQIGRFVSADSVTGNPASPASLNRYSYVLNNPYKYVDPTGETPLVAAALAVGAAGFAGAAVGSYIDHGKVDWGYAGEWAGKGFLIGLTGGMAAAASGPAAGTVSAADVASTATVASAGATAAGGSGAAQVASSQAQAAVKEGMTVYRVWGGRAGPWGQSWTTVDPGTVSNFRSAAGLPDANAGRFVSQGILKSLQGVTSRGAQVLKPGQQGGLPELVVPKAQEAIELQRVSGVNPPF